MDKLAKPGTASSSKIVMQQRNQFYSITEIQAWLWMIKAFFVLSKLLERNSVLGGGDWEEGGIRAHQVWCWLSQQHQSLEGTEGRVQSRGWHGGDEKRVLAWERKAQDGSDEGSASTHDKQRWRKIIALEEMKKWWFIGRSLYDKCL